MTGMETFASQVWLDVGHPEYNTEEDPSLTARGLVFWGSGRETVLKPGLWLHSFRARLII